MGVKISVIVPIYNSELYLDECIQSVLNQTLKDIELLLIDDESTDSSLEICHKYEKQDNRVKVFSNKNVGQGIERNYGVKKSTGKYIAFLDSDDKYKNDMLEKLYFKAIENDADIVSAGYADIKNNAVVKEHELVDKILNNEENIKSTMLDLISYGDVDGYFGCIAVWDSIFRKDLIINNNIEFLSERYVYSEDLLFKLTAMKYSKKIVFCNDVLYLYRVNQNSFTNKIDYSIINKIVNLYDEVYLLLENVLNETILKKRLINRTFFTLRFNIKKVSKTKESIDFYKLIVNNKKIMDIIEHYQPNNIKNRIIYYLLKYRMFLLLQVITKLK